MKQKTYREEMEFTPPLKIEDIKTGTAYRHRAAGVVNVLAGRDGPHVECEVECYGGERHWLNVIMLQPLNAKRQVV